MYRTHDCGALRPTNNSLTVTLAGWVQTVRKFGSITFVDLRDRYGVTQLFFDEAMTAQLETKPVGREYVLQVKGVVRERSSKNPKIPTGEIEVLVKDYHILSTSAVPPFTIEEHTDGGEELRMKYRYLDLRRGPLQRNLQLRHTVNHAVRQFLHEQGFLDIETPFLIKSTPEGARDFVVPSRVHEGEFYALPQSPQTFKQLLMVSGYDRYYQIVKCFRDEDLRADRQPEFTQIDCEMAFVEQEDVLNMFEALIKHVLKTVKQVEVPTTFPRLSWEACMRRYGNDKPDIRFAMELVYLKAPQGDLTPEREAVNLVNGADFKVFDEAELVVALNIKGGAESSRKQIDEWTGWVKRPQIGMSGLAYVKYNPDGTIKSSVDKFYDASRLMNWLEAASAEPGDLLLILSGPTERSRKAIGELRLYLGSQFGLRDPKTFAPLWVLDFPLLEFTEEDTDGGGAGRWVARHHPFTAPKPDQIGWMDDPSKLPYIQANAYDMVLNGQEIGGGSIRIFERSLQEKMFRLLGISNEEAEEKFGFLLEALQFGAPPHGGIAFGFDRVCALLGEQETIRDFIAFPKNNAARDVMLNAPAALSEKQLREVHLEILNRQEGNPPERIF